MRAYRIKSVPTHSPALSHFFVILSSCESYVKVAYKMTVYFYNIIIKYFYIYKNIVYTYTHIHAYTYIHIHIHIYIYVLRTEQKARVGWIFGCKGGG